MTIENYMQYLGIAFGTVFVFLAVVAALFLLFMCFITIKDACYFLQDRQPDILIFPMQLKRKDEEITRLRADLAAVTAERDRMREALKDALVWLGDPHGGRPVMSVDSIRNIANRAVLEGVTDKKERKMSDKYIMYDLAEFNKIEIKSAENSDEITCLRAELAAVTEERDRMREALRPIVAEARSVIDDLRTKPDHHKFLITVTAGDLRAALESVTEPPR